MSNIKQGDVVGRKSYNFDIYFKVVELVEDDAGRKFARLKGIDLRLCATAPVSDLVKIEPSKVAEYWRQCMTKNRENLKRVLTRRKQERQKSFMRAVEDKGQACKIESFDVPGSVLHLDGDGEYLDLCMTTYKQLSIPAYGYKIPEKEQAKHVVDLLRRHRPDLLVLTGHDGFIKGRKDYADINNYHSSAYFVKAVKAAREYEKSRDDLVIFAGACQSHYEAILEAGANFASSPKRVLIHAFDPVFVIEKVAYTSIYDPIRLKDIISSTITGFNGIGGLETRGKYRLGIPRSQIDLD